MTGLTVPYCAPARIAPISECPNESSADSRLRKVRGDRRAWIDRHGDAPASLPVWSSRSNWLEDVRVWVSSTQFVPACVAADVSIAAVTVSAVAQVWAQFADHGTGRNAAVTRARIADELGCSVKTVGRAWWVLQEGGFAVEVSRGHGSHSTPSYGCRPSIWHLVSRPSPAESGDNVPLPPSGGFGTSTPVGSFSPSVCKPTPETNSHPNKARRRWRAVPRPLALQRLAGQLAGHSERPGEPSVRLGNSRAGTIHGLSRVHVGAVCDALVAAGIDPACWSAAALIEALDADMRISGFTWPDELQRPAAFLAHRLRRITRPSSTTAPSAVAAEARPVMAATTGPAPYVSPPPVTVSAGQRQRIAQAQAQIREDLAVRKAARWSAQRAHNSPGNIRGTSIECGGSEKPSHQDEGSVAAGARR